MGRGLTGNRLPISLRGAFEVYADTAAFGIRDLVTFATIETPIVCPGSGLGGLYKGCVGETYPPPVWDAWHRWFEALPGLRHQFGIPVGGGLASHSELISSIVGLCTAGIMST